ncbi:MAG TPA: hypothetical protein VEX18_05870 [Polyangiaceae bacterium]|nr:hypothetical protein [Polyangiaceae bacterium]
MDRHATQELAVAGHQQTANEEWASALDLIGGHDEDSFARASSQLLSRGDATTALRLSTLGLRTYPNSRALREQRTRALHQLQARYQQVNPASSSIPDGRAKTCRR